MSKVTFLGPQKLIQLQPGVTGVDVKNDVYTAWKAWMVQGDNAKFLPAISCVGGDPISAEKALGSTFFLENGWRIRPQEADHTLVVTGNLYVREGGSPFIQPEGEFNVLISIAQSNLVDVVYSGGGSGTVDLSPVSQKLSDIEALVCSLLAR